MYERAKYFGNKFTSNGIAGLILTSLFFYSTITNHDPFNYILIVFPIVAVVWLFFGISITRKLKAKHEFSEQKQLTDENNSYKQIDLLFSITIISLLFLNMKHIPYTRYLMIGFLLVYIGWFYSQVKLLNTYLKG